MIIKEGQMVKGKRGRNGERYAATYHSSLDMLYRLSPHISWTLSTKYAQEYQYGFLLHDFVLLTWFWRNVLLIWWFYEQGGEDILGTWWEFGDVSERLCLVLKVIEKENEGQSSVVKVATTSTTFSLAFHHPCEAKEEEGFMVIAVLSQYNDAGNMYASR